MPDLRAHPRLRLLLRIGAGLLVALVVVAVVPPFRRAAAVGTSKVILFVAAPLAPDIADFRELPQTTKLLAVDGSTVAELDKSQRRVPVTLDSLPEHVKQAVLAAEDEDFYSHGGVDPSAVFRAFLRTAQGRTQGGSTITQQLAKINYTARERTLLRKLKEVLYATRLEKRYSKDELLERYVNQVYFGEGSYGIGAASETFFGKPADQLTPAEAALLTGKIRSPEGLNPRKDLPAVQKRRDQVLRNMGDEGWLKRPELKEALAAPVVLAEPRAADADALGRAPHFTELVKREARRLDALGVTRETRDNQLFTGGLTIETTLDPKVFDATAAAVRERLGEPGDPDTAAATVQPGDGAVRSLFGGLDFATTQYDMSSLSGRQAGSSFKPFVYLASLRKGIDPRSTFDGTSGRQIPCYGDKPVSNYAGEDAAGAITVDDALVKSVNVVFVDLGCQTGVRDVLRTAQDDGIPEDASTAQGAIFLGGLDQKGVNALEMASSFATFAAKGVYAEPYGIARIKDRHGRTIYEHKPSTREVFDPEQVGVLNNPLQRVVTEGTGRGAAIGRPVAGKTGTTQDNVDAWFIGYTPQLATAVWVGYADNRPMANVHGRAVTGGSFPASIFSDVMRKALEGVRATPLFTASPDQLQLTALTTLPPTTSSTASTTTSPTSTTTPADASTTTSQPGNRPTTTTSPTPTSTTTTTTKKPPPTTTTTPTTAPPTTTSTSTSTTKP